MRGIPTRGSGMGRVLYPRQMELRMWAIEKQIATMEKDPSYSQTGKGIREFFARGAIMGAVL
jgi:hypothetical protein